MRKHFSKAVTKYAFTLAILCLISSISSANSYTINVIEPAVSNSLFPPKSSSPSPQPGKSTIKIRACRGEFEPASFAIYASSELTKVAIEAGPITGPGKQWPNTSVDIRVVKAYPISVVGAGTLTLPTLLVHDDASVSSSALPTTSKSGQQVVDKTYHDSVSFQPVSFVGRKQIWVTVHVPEDAAPGTYTVPLTISPQNETPSKLDIEVEVYPFTLLQPMIDYSIYYPSHLLAPGQKADQFNQVTPEQMKIELEDMRDHGVTNPNIWDSPTTRPDGSVDFTPLSRVLDLRESVGIRPDTLYLCNHPVALEDRPLKAHEKDRIAYLVKEINEYARSRGYKSVYYVAGDEWWGDKLTRERDSILAVQQAGGKVFAACISPYDAYQRVGDILDLPVLQANGAEHMEYAARQLKPADILANVPLLSKSGSFERMQTSDEYRQSIDGWHQRHQKVFTYMNPIAGFPLPDYQRRNEGLGLWRVGFDGTMTWAYIHIESDGPNQQMLFSHVLRTESGVIGKLSWEGYREGVDDVRYLTTLLDALNRTRGRFPNAPLVRKVDKWINGLDAVNGNLDRIRHDMARWIVALSKLGYQQLDKTELLTNVKRDTISITSLSEPWHFKMDTENRGLNEKWFSSNPSLSSWTELRVDNGKGWGSDPGFGWYSTTLKPSGVLTGTKNFAYVYFEGCDEDAWVYLNGQLVGERSVQSTGLLPSQIWIMPFSVPLGKLSSSRQNTLTVRVFNRGGMGGLWQPVYLLESKQRLNADQIRALMQTQNVKAPIQ